MEHRLDTPTTDNYIQTWKQKELHGAHLYQLEQPHVCKQSLNLWLKQGLLYGFYNGYTR
jgi:hypothetical protein